MKKNKRTKLYGALLVATSFVTVLWAGFKSGSDNLAQPHTKAPVSEKQALFNEFVPSNPKYATLGFFGAMTLIGGISIISKKEK